jgi:hypothetical protein
MSTQIYIYIRERGRGDCHIILCEFVILKLFVFAIRIGIGRVFQRGGDDRRWMTFPIEL